MQNFIQLSAAVIMLTEKNTKQHVENNTTVTSVGNDNNMHGHPCTLHSWHTNTEKIWLRA